jgi:uncharacterized protein
MPKPLAFAVDSVTRGAGIAFVAPTGRALFLKRSAAGDHPGEWCFPGGGSREGEDPYDTALREGWEEIGDTFEDQGAQRLNQEISPEGVNFTTFLMRVPREFEPHLNEEHDGYQWADLDNAPEPLHPGVSRTLPMIGQDSWEDLPRDADGRWGREKREFQESNHRRDTKTGQFIGATDVDEIYIQQGVHWWPPEQGARPEGMPVSIALDRAIMDRIALDRESVRSYDVDGRLHISLANISKATVNPYYGFEIPGSEQAGLDPRKVYYLLRDPQELANAAPTFNNLPILSTHRPVSAENPEKEIIVGSTGTDAVFRAPFLANSLVFWDQSAIDAIESNAKRELSAAYRYMVDWTPGVFEGKRYDGVMRQIIGNHIAQVTDGRAGSDVVVGDSQLREVNAMAQQVLSRRAMMAKGALFAGLMPLLAQDASPAQTMKDLDRILAAVASDNWKVEKPKIIAEVTKTFTPRLLAKDAGMGGLAKLLDHLDGEAATAAEPGGKPVAATPTAPIPGKTEPSGPAKPIDGAVAAKPQGPGKPPVETESALREGEGLAEDDPIAEIMEMLKQHLPPDVHAAVHQKMKALRPNPEHAEIAPEGSPEAAAPAAATPAKPGMDEPPGGPGQPKPPVSTGKEVPVDDPAKAAMKQATVTQPAMDAAIKVAKDQTRKETMALMRSITDAEAFVAPWVGKMALAFDSAEDVFKAALEAMEYDLTDVPPAAFKHILAAQPKPGEVRATSGTKIAADASLNASGLMAKLLPNAATRRVM